MDTTNIPAPSQDLDGAPATGIGTKPGATDLALRNEPFQLVKRAGDLDFRMRFRIGALRFEETTLCSEIGLAVMVARATYVEVRDLLAGSVPPSMPAASRHRAWAPQRPAA